jgi:hypothetical protein
VGSINALVPASQIRLSPTAKFGPSDVQAFLLWTEIISRTVSYGLAVADLFARDATNKAAFSENAGSLCPTIISYTPACTRP